MTLSPQENSPIYLHQNIKFLRRQLRISQEELANRVGLNRGNIASYENGSAEPKICNLLKLAKLFGVPIMALARQDLQDEQQMSEASDTFRQLDASELQLMEQFAKRAAELEKVIESIHTCFQYKTEDLEQNPSPKQVRTVALKFEELYEASSELARNHQQLIEFINCRCR